MLKKTFTTLTLFILSLMTLVSGCSSSNANTNSNIEEVQQTITGYVITPGVQCTMQMANATFSYVISTEQTAIDKVSEMQKQAREIVSAWWDNPKTFKDPIAVLPVTFYGANTPRGFQGDGYIFIDPFQPDSFATLVHELIHLQNEDALILKKPDGREGGRELMEMIVEKITVNLLGIENVGIPTNNFLFFENCPKLKENFSKLETAFKQDLSFEETYRPLYGTDYENVVITLDYYSVLTEVIPPNEFSKFLEEILGIKTEEYEKIVRHFS